MKKVFWAVFAVFVGLTVAYRVLGGWFDKKFWLDFLPGLMANLLILALGVLVIDSILGRERLGRLGQANARESQFVLELSCRLAYLILHHLGLATGEEVGQGGLDFRFARDRLRGIDLGVTFGEQLMQAEDRKAFAAGLAKALQDHAFGLSNALDKIHPKPDPSAAAIADKMFEAIGVLSGFKDYLGIFAQVNAEVAPDDRINQDQIDRLTRIAFPPIGERLRQLQHCIEELSAKAEANELFARLD